MLPSLPAITEGSPLSFCSAPFDRIAEINFNIDADDDSVSGCLGMFCVMGCILASWFTSGSASGVLKIKISAGKAKVLQWLHAVKDLRARNEPSWFIALVQIFKTSPLYVRRIAFSPSLQCKPAVPVLALIIFPYVIRKHCT